MRELFFHGKEPEANQLVKIRGSLQSIVIRAYFTLTVRTNMRELFSGEGSPDALSSDIFLEALLL